MAPIVKPKPARMHGNSLPSDYQSVTSDSQFAGIVDNSIGRAATREAMRATGTSQKAQSRGGSLSGCAADRGTRATADQAGERVKPLMTLKELAEALGVPYSTLAKHQMQGKCRQFEVSRPIGYRRYSRERVEEFLSGRSIVRIGAGSRRAS